MWDVWGETETLQAPSNCRGAGRPGQSSEVLPGRAACPAAGKPFTAAGGSWVQSSVSRGDLVASQLSVGGCCRVQQVEDRQASQHPTVWRQPPKKNANSAKGEKWAVVAGARWALRFCFIQASPGTEDKIQRWASTRGRGWHPQATSLPTIGGSQAAMLWSPSKWGTGGACPCPGAARPLSEPRFPHLHGGM